VPAISTNNQNTHFEAAQYAKIGTLLNLFCVGFSIYTLLYTLMVTGRIPNTLIVIFQVFQFMSVAMMVGSACMLIKSRSDNKYVTTIFLLYVFWELICVVRGFEFNPDFIKNSLFDAWFGISIYLTPLVMLFPREVNTYKKFINISVFLGSAYVILNLIYYKQLMFSFRDFRTTQALVEYYGRNLSIPIGFILFTYLYHSSTKTLFALGVILATFLLAAMKARRGLMFTTMCIMFLAYLVFYFTNRGQIMKVVFSVFLVISLLMYAAFVYMSQRNGTFGLISSRLYEDTRSRVISNFYDNMNPVDWAIGRGMSGQYICPGIDEGYRITTTRSVIENGFLQIILKEGLLGMVLTGLLAIPAMIKGFFKSKNLISKAAAIWILLYIANLYTSVWNGFILFYILIWLSIGICLDPVFTQKSDEEIKAEFS
jgi:hypothetical protein